MFLNICKIYIIQIISKYDDVNDLQNRKIVQLIKIALSFLSWIQSTSVYQFFVKMKQLLSFFQQNTKLQDENIHKIYVILLFIMILLLLLSFNVKNIIFHENQYILQMLSDDANKNQDNADKYLSSKIEQSINQKQCIKKEFKLQKIDLLYNNTAEIIDSYKEITIQPSIVNLLCLGQGEKVVKITKINIAGKTIQIKDQISINSLSFRQKEHKNKNQNRQKLQIIKQSILAPAQDKLYKKNNKNIVKNMIRLFKNWLDKEQMFEIKQMLSKLTDQTKFNNSLIEKMALDIEINKAFYDFLTNHVEQIINASKIMDKKSHILAIKCYLRFLKVRPISKVDCMKINP